MALKLPELTNIDYTTLDFDGIISLSQKIIRNHPEYFSNIDDFTESNAARMTIELVAYIVDLLADRVDWIANEMTLPTATQKQSVMNLLKIINYRLELPRAASANVTATISSYVDPFLLPARYSVPAKDREGNNSRFELLSKNDDGKYVYEGVGSGYEFDTGFQATPVLSHNDLAFYEGTSRREIFTMTGRNNESVQLSYSRVEEGSIRVWRITRNAGGDITSRRELPIVTSFISPEAQAASGSNLPPLKLEPTENNGVFLVFGERPVVSTFNPGGGDEILVWYRTTNGENGNITRNSINYTTTLMLQGRTVQVQFINSVAGTGGSESESIEHAKRYGPLSLTTVEKTVNPDDFVVLLQRFGGILDAIAYGKSNEPNRIFADYGYNIPPYETWIYPVFNKQGWESLPTYTYRKAFQVTRPYTNHGPLDKELVEFESEVDIQPLKKLASYIQAENYTNVIVSDFYNETQYVPGTDFVIDLEARQLIRLQGGDILPSSIVVVQYFENEQITTTSEINFATGNRQPIPRQPVFPGTATHSWRSDLQKEFAENELSTNDYNYPNGDYRIDYTTSEIVKNETYPFLDSHSSFGTSNTIIDGVNNQFIIAFDGLNRVALNSDQDFKLGAYSGWATIGNGNPQALAPGLYYFKIGVDGGDVFEYEVNLTNSSYLPRELVEAINSNAVRVFDSEPFTNLDVSLFADGFKSPQSPILTFMSKSSGNNSSVALENGTSGQSLFGLNNLSNINLGAGNSIDLLDLTFLSRCTLNSMGLLSSFSGQELPAGFEEKPEIFSKINLNNASSFDFPASQNTVTFEIQGTNLGTWDGSYDVAFTLNSNSSKGRPSGPYNLTTYQGRMDLIQAMQENIDGTLTQDIIEVFWAMGSESNYRVGFRLQDTAGSADPIIKVKTPTSDSALSVLQLSDRQSSRNSNLTEALVSPDSDMTEDFYIRIRLLGAFGDAALIQAKANSATHNNTLSLFGFGLNQKGRGSGILSRTILAESDVIDDGGLLYVFYDSGSSKNNEMAFSISAAPTGDGDYTLIIPPGSYNFSELVDQLNDSLEVAEINGTPTDISNFLVFEKREGLQKLRLIMKSYDTSSTETPNVQILVGAQNEDINTIHKLGFEVEQDMSTYSTIFLHYSGDWVSSAAADQSEERTIFNYLSDKRLISQDYLIKDPRMTSFDVKANVYCAKGFDRKVISNQVKSRIREEFRVDNREFAEPVAITNITKIIEDVEGTIFTNVEYFGKDYQIFKYFLDQSKSAKITAKRPAEPTSERWKSNAAFKITIDGTARNGINNDGEYLITVGNNWTSGDYDSLLNKLQSGDGTTGGIEHAIPLSIGESERNLGSSIKVNHSSGIFSIETLNEGPRVYMKIENPDSIFTNGYQSLSRQTTLLQSQYGQGSTYSITVSIDGGSAVNYEITAPLSGDWPLSQVASQLDAVMPSTVAVGIDDESKIRITSLLGGNQSTINITSGTSGLDLITIVGPLDSPVNGSHGYVSCIDESQDGSFFFGEIVESFGRKEEPTLEENKESYNYKTSIPAVYDEVLFVSDDFYQQGSTDTSDQLHGLIFNFIEFGSDNNG